MDPFNEVEEDAWSQVKALETFVGSTKLITEASQLDFGNNYQELEETLEDLKQAVAISESTPEQFKLTANDISHRKQIVLNLGHKIVALNRAWTDKVNDPNRLREVTTMSNRISQDGMGENPFNDRYALNEEFDKYQQQETIADQDLQLDLIHETMRSLNQQAAIMGDELEDQGFMLEDLDEEMDSVGSKLQRGMKRVNFVIEKNRERASDCCIGVLVVALCVLLVLIIVV